MKHVTVMTKIVIEEALQTSFPANRWRRGPCEYNIQDRGRAFGHSGPCLVPQDPKSLQGFVNRT